MEKVEKERKLQRVSEQIFVKIRLRYTNDVISYYYRCACIFKVDKSPDNDYLQDVHCSQIDPSKVLIFSRDYLVKTALLY